MAAANDPKVPPKTEPTRPGAGFDDDEDDWRHAPVAPKDEGILDSIGRAISEPVTGADESPVKPRPDGSRG